MEFAQIGANIVKIMRDYWKVNLIEGVSTTLILTCIAVSLGAILGTLVAIMKMSRFRVLRFIVTAYVEIIRGTPILLQLYIFYFCLPQMLPFLKLSAFMWVAIAMCINSSAYVSEVIRSGIQAVDKGQTEAARCLGLSSGQTMRKVILPQVLRNILPSVSNEFVINIKDTSVLNVIGVTELYYFAGIIKRQNFQTFQTYLVVCVLYFILTFAVTRLLRFAEKKLEGKGNYTIFGSQSDSNAEIHIRREEKSHG